MSDWLHPMAWVALLYFRGPWWLAPLALAIVLFALGFWAGHWFPGRIMP